MAARRVGKVTAHISRGTGTVDSLAMLRKPTNSPSTATQPSPTSNTPLSMGATLGPAGAVMELQSPHGDSVSIAKVTASVARASDSTHELTHPTQQYNQLESPGNPDTMRFSALVTAQHALSPSCQSFIPTGAVVPVSTEASVVNEEGRNTISINLLPVSADTTHQTCADTTPLPHDHVIQSNSDR